VLSLAQTAAFVAPPRTIADIRAILEQEKPDPQIISKLREEAEAPPPPRLSKSELAVFHHNRCQARRSLGDVQRAIADCDAAVKHATGSMNANDLTRTRFNLASLYGHIGEPKRALEILLQLARDVNAKGTQGFLFSAHAFIAQRYIQLGDFNQAEAYIRRNQGLAQEARGWSTYGGYRRAMWESSRELGEAELFAAHGQFLKAEMSFRRVEAGRRDALRLVQSYESLPPSRDSLEAAIDNAIAMQGLMKARQGQIAEGEAYVRRALLSRLKATGQYHLQTASYIGHLANLLIEQGRFTEAEQLTRRQIEIQRTIGVPTNSQTHAIILNQLASNLNLQGRWDEAAKVYADLDEATKSWDSARREALTLNTEHIVTLFNTNNLPAGIAASERLLVRDQALFGEQHVNTALTRGLLGIGLARANRDADALREFKLAVPILMAQSREANDDDPTLKAARTLRVQFIVEAYVALLSRMGPSSGVDPAGEGFQLIDVIRGQSVQRALTESGARASARNPALAELVRKSQDLEKQIGAQLGLLNNVLTLPPEQRDANPAKALQADIDKLRATRDALKKELAAKFRDYASLVEPASPSVDDIRAVMRPDEAFVSIYIGQEASFVWAVPKSGPVAFSAISMRTADLETMVAKLRLALEPDVARVSDIPAFDVALAHDLYARILKPIEVGWRPAKSLIVATNGALGLLPLGVLPTELASVKPDTEAYFAGYRDVPWLARSHAVTVVPSAAAFRTLRQLPPASEKRERLIGFGDPIFSKEHAAAPAQSDATTQLAKSDQIAMRGVPLVRRAAPQTQAVNSAQLKILPRLPDTADELKSIALALQTDPAKVLNLGVSANEEAVKKADLWRYRIIVFATHGLVPGELDGLHQPALALTAPDIAGVPGDGLLTMDEILALKLDADWVVLSACNTGAGAGAGAEVASGLGRAFFYAGTRAILVTNWSVHSQSARDLVSDLFHRQAENPAVTRSEALRQTTMALLDGPGFTDDQGNTLFTYAHPLFWAPYTIIGDGG
jgi:CHAT domain-containing protein